MCYPETLFSKLSPPRLSFLSFGVWQRWFLGSCGANWADADQSFPEPGRNPDRHQLYTAHHHTITIARKYRYMYRYKYKYRCKYRYRYIYKEVIGKNSTLQHGMACQHRICVAAVCSEQHGLLAYSFYISIHVGYRIWGYLVRNYCSV